MSVLVTQRLKDILSKEEDEVTRLELLQVWASDPTIETDEFHEVAEYFLKLKTLDKLKN